LEEALASSFWEKINAKNTELGSKKAGLSSDF
jgi:hypothetical protein